MAATKTKEIGAEAVATTEKPKAKRVLRPILIPGKVVEVEEPNHCLSAYSEYKTKPGEVVIVESITKEDRVYVLDASMSQKIFMKKGSKLKIVKKPAQAEFLASLSKSSSQKSIYSAKYLTGFDPEVFAVDASGQVIPAFKFLPPKDDPFKFNAVSGSVQENYVFWDGFQAEFSTKLPSGCHAYSVDNIQRSLEVILNRARKLDPEATLTHKCVVDVPFEMMQDCTQEQAGLGCSPSKNVYGEKKHLDVLVPSELPFRFAGCHIHHNTEAAANFNNELAVKMLDAVAGVVSVSVLEGMEDERRRKFYGMAGEYRLPKHGLEYRVLSSAVLAHPILMIFFLDFTRQVVGAAVRLSFLWDASEEETQDVINNLDVPQAKKIIERNKGIIGKLIAGIYANENIAKAMSLVEKGAMNMLPIGDMENNWRLNKDWVQHSASTNCSVCKWIPK